MTRSTSITIPASVTYIGAGAFAGCKGINKFIVQQGNEVYTTIDGVLYNKKTKQLVAVPHERRSISIPDGIISIGDYAFYGTLIVDIDNIPTSLMKIGNHAFESTNLEIAEKTFQGVTSIGDYAFRCASVTNLDFPIVEKIGAHAFENAVIPNLPLCESLKEIGEYAFSDVKVFWEATSAINLSNTRLTTIPKYAFQGYEIQEQKNDPNWSNLIICFPDTLEVIDDYAFSNINAGIYTFTVTVTIPDTVRYIGEHAFGDQSYNDDVKWHVVFAENTDNLDISKRAFDGITFDNEFIALPSGTVSVGEEAFNAKKLPVLRIPSTVQEIGNNVCNRAITELDVDEGTYAYRYAYENGFTIHAISDDMSWLDN